MAIKKSSSKSKDIKDTDENNIQKRKILFDKLKTSLIKSQTGSKKDSAEIEFLLKRL